MPLDQILSKSAENFGEKAAIVWNDKEYSFKDLDSMSNKFAHALLEKGLTKGDRVCIFMQNSPEFVVSHFGIIKAGCITVPLNVMYRKRELVHMVNDSGATVMVTSEGNLPYVLEVRNDLKSLREIIVTSSNVPEGCLSFYRLLENGVDKPTDVRNADDDVAVICYTSGTTGSAKGAMITHSNFISNISTLSQLWELTDRDKLMMALPMFHVHGLGIAVHGMVYCGYTMVLLERFDAKKVMEGIDKYKCTVFMGVPTMYIKLLELDDCKYDLSSMRLWTVGSAPMPVDAMEKFKERYGFELLERYGMTETAVVIASNPLKGKRKPGSVGLPIPGVEVKIVDDEDNPLPVNEVGEIVVRGPNVMKGYWNRPQETEEAFRNGWFHTGDLGKIDEEGYLHIVGRKKEMIISGGFKVFPREVEEVLHTHPKVKEVAVVGIPDPVRGESVKAYIVLKDGTTATEKELDEYCRNNLAAFKVPRIYEFVSSIPRTPSGKILNRLLSQAKVKDLMIPDVKTIDRRVSAYEAAKYMKESNVGSLIITDGDVPIGIVTMRDILYKVISLGSLGKDISLSNIMSTPLLTVEAEEDISKAAALMRRWNVWRLAVRNGNGQLIGLISGTDIFRAFVGRKMEIPRS
ncbi:MAG: long-chain-fatty-acid--CoA ligase [Candidatus Methanomethylicia archaeon]|jgi:long-chain acyl-CoA synthetase|nr:long-chain-fatty-acid--CoA ligase [Candidatus Methanomethylicia archaeon]MCQ5373605.1 long-chain-fatty-acid--CoA ligase [Candidatus Methanomethylicia archaeon]